jgi:hypothetical protein
MNLSDSLLRDVPTELQHDEGAVGRNRMLVLSFFFYSGNT